MSRSSSCGVACVNVPVDSDKACNKPLFYQRGMHVHAPQGDLGDLTEPEGLIPARITGSLRPLGRSPRLESRPQI